MKSFALGVAAVVLLSVSLLAGEYLVNEEVAYGLRVTFTEPVTLTQFGDVLTEVDPMGESTQFLFSGAQLPAWVGHGLAWTPASTRITSYEWLSREEVAAIGVVRVPLTLTETFSVVLAAASGDAIDATITRTVSQEQVPFVVEYSVELPASASSITWTDLGSSMSIEGPEARFVFLSNAEAVAILLDVETEAGTTYSWSDEIDFLLHNKTEIALDATQFVREEEIASVEWSAANGDPDDARTFPIADVSATTTTLVSEWPNVLEIECEITKQDGSVVSKQVDALVYFRDGTPFEVRSIAATVFDSGIPPDELVELLDIMFPNLRDLGFNAVTTAVNWWYGYPDTDGNFNIHPIYNTDSENRDPRGSTITPAQLTTYLATASNEGFSVDVQMRQFVYGNDSELRENWGGWGPNFGFKWSDAWLYGENGYENMLLTYLPILKEYSVASVFLGAENGDVAAHGGAKARSFYQQVIAGYREAGFHGSLGYSLAYFHSPDWPEMPPLRAEYLDPDRSGIPWPDMDYVGLTFYPKLTDSFDSATSEMYSEALSQIDEYIRPLYETYGKPIYIEECYCYGHDGCAMRPVDESWRFSRDYDPEEQRRWHTALLRALADANLQGGTRLIGGVTIYTYSLDVWLSAQSFRERVMAANLNTPEREDLRLLAKVFFREAPLRQPQWEG